MEPTESLKAGAGAPAPNLVQIKLPIPGPATALYRALDCALLLRQVR